MHQDKVDPSGCALTQPPAQARQHQPDSEVFTCIYVGLERFLKFREVNTMENGFFSAHLSKPLVINAVK